MEVVGTIGVFVLLTAVITVGIWQLAATWRAKVVVGREEAYRALAESAEREREATRRQLEAIDERLAAVDTRLASIERVLREVE
ncbi:hypothetical protein GCM10009634_78440 [Saccharothrix xinjiangensis]